MTVEQIEQLYKEGRKEIINKTRRYLTAPVVRYYGEDFLSLLRENLHVIACGINDTLHPKEYCLYVLVDSSRSLFFNNVLTRLDSFNFIEHYPFGELLSGKLHMVVIDIPEKFKNAYDMFSQSKYSMMFSKQDIQKYILSVVGLSDAAQTMLKTPEKRASFEKEVNYYGKYYMEQSELDKRVDQVTWITLNEDSELDFLMRPSEEIFNY